MSDGFALYDQWKCAGPTDEHPDPPDPHEQCEREIEALETELAAARKPLTYRELFDAVGARFAGTYRIGVESWCYTPLRMTEGVTSTWSINWFPTPGNAKDCRLVTGATAADAFAQFCAQQPSDRAGSDELDLVGDGKVTP